jgi:hypothetical protein
VYRGRLCESHDWDEQVELLFCIETIPEQAGAI